MKISILGTDYTIKKKPYNAEPYFKDNNCDGFSDGILHEIVIGDMLTFPGWEKETKERAYISEQQTLRHEIVHAFFDESGLQASALQYDGAWSRNEEMVDWFAWNGPKIYKAWVEAGAITQ